jgi:outer membrane protein assembly factor BamA
MADLRATLTSHAGDQLDTAKLDADRTALEIALVDRGYLSAKVSTPHVMFDSNGGAFITFAVTQGPLFHIRSIAITGASSRDAGIVTISKGEVVRSDRLERARDAMAERLVARGKQANVVSVKLAPDEAAAAVDVVLAAR